MSPFLICENPKCHMVLDLRESGRELRSPEAAFAACSECGGQWSSTCPYCAEPLDVDREVGPPRCLKCRRKLGAEAASAAAAGGRR